MLDMGTDEMLIEAVKGYPFLYDTNDKEYHDIRKKDNAWQEIAEHFENMTAVMCKKRWFNLRDAFRKSFKMKQMLSEQAAKKRKLWRFETQMAFILPHMSELRDQVGNLPSSALQPDNVTYTFSDTSSMDSNVGFNLGTTNGGFSVESIRSEMCDESEQYPRTAINIKQELESAAPSRKDKSAPPVDFWQFASEKPPQEQTKRSDALTTFFRAMEDTVRGFSPEIMIEAKGKIAALVNELEMKNWQQQQQ